MVVKRGWVYKFHFPAHQLLKSRFFFFFFSIQHIDHYKQHFTTFFYLYCNSQRIVHLHLLFFLLLLLLYFFYTLHPHFPIEGCFVGSPSLSFSPPLASRNSSLPSYFSLEDLSSETPLPITISNVYPRGWLMDITLGTI